MALLLIVGRFVAFAINYVNINLNGMVLLFTLSSYLIISFLFLAYTPDKGFMKHLNLKTKNSVFGRNIFIIGNIFVLVLTVILIIKSAWFTFLSNELFLILSSVLFLIFLVFYYINHITYAEFNHIQSEEEAEKKQVLFEDIIQYTIEGVMVLNEEDQIVYANDIYYEFRGFDENIIGLNYFTEFDGLVKNHALEVKKSLKPHFFEFSHKSQNIDRNFNGWVIPFIKNDKFDGVVITTFDISESIEKQSALKKSIKERNALLTEVHHRVKNNMQIIISLLSIQSHKIDNLEAKEAIFQTQSRVRSMALVHENLYKNLNFEDMDIFDYINDLVREIKGSYITSKKITFKMDLVKTYINLDIAISLGLIINELLTNSIKYAFEGRDEGTVWVKLSENDGLFTLIIEDDGIGINNSVSKGTGIGSTLINSLVAQIEGTYAIESKNGTKVSITFKNKV
ncbi:MAG: sensor histidine kinase [Methanobacteriaceae archaeon]|nr:sensor histidine kinase [Methanobacteriaceae archaeon]